MSNSPPNSNATSPPQGTSQEQFLWTLVVDNYGRVGRFDNGSGGDANANVTKHRQGGMGPEITLPALPTYTDITLERMYDDYRDHALIRQLRPLVGRNHCTVTMQPLDQDGHSFGYPRVSRGRLSNLKDGSTTSDSTAPRMWSIDVAVETVSG
jgi:hypothetical protein